MRKLHKLSNIFMLLFLIFSAEAFARGGGGGFGGGFGHGGGGGFNGGFHGNDGINNGLHDNGYNYRGYENNNFHGAYDNDYVGYDGAVVVANPVVDDDSENCQQNQVCNAYGQCWSEDQCD